MSSAVCRDEPDRLSGVGFCTKQDDCSSRTRLGVHFAGTASC